MKALHMVAFILLAIGGVNWGLVGLGSLMGTNLNVVNLLLSSMPQLESIVYVLVGLSAVWIVIGHKKDCRMCSM